MKKENKVLYQNKPWANNPNNVWLASTIHLLRNVEKFPFPAKLERSRRDQIISLVNKFLLHSKKLKKPIIFKSEDIGPNEKEYLFEHFLSSQSFQQAHSGEAFVLDETGKCFISLNFNNHIHFELIDCRGELEASWNYLVNIETELGKAINYAFSPKFGFLTSDPNICGTAFVLSVFLQPSALIHKGKIDEVLKKISRESLSITGISGKGDEIIGDIYAIKNNFTLGITEENIISSIRLFTTKLLVEENSARASLRQGDFDEVKDKVSRAYGVLMHSYQIEPIEALNSIGLLKLGADVGWLKGVSPQELNRLFFDCRRAHLLSHQKQELTKEEIPHARSEFIHNTLKKVKLVI